MFISIAHATTEVGSEVASTPSTGEFIMNNLLIFGAIILVYYFIFLRPQTKRFKEERAMLDSLKKGDIVITSGGLVATITKIISDTEVEIDLGGVTVTAIRHTLQTRKDENGAPLSKTVKEDKIIAEAPKTKKAPAKKVEAKKPVTKKTVTKKSTTKKKV